MPWESAKPTPPSSPMGVVVPLAVGQELRDEFTCPITRSLMRVPVIAADGHTYDRAAIERWLVNHDNSPKTGDALEHKMLVPNHNLKRLIDDLVVEGGAGLYSGAPADGGGAPKDGRDERLTFDTDADELVSRAPPNRQTSLVSEPVLLLQCLGPAESEWNGRSFEVTRQGVVGGRRRPHGSSTHDDSIGERDFMPFADSTVSRRHFEIHYDATKRAFGVRDLGSASGTFRRLRSGARAELELGAMAMIGKHQLCVVSCTDPRDDLAREDAGPSHSADPCVALECFAPDGSPLQGKIYKITEKGATLGRRTTNAVAFSHDVDGETVGVDSSVSAEHARVAFDHRTKTFSLSDGTSSGRASTNGTWIRLSALHTKSDVHILDSGDELLIGTIRFHVTATQTVVERDL